MFLKAVEFIDDFLKMDLSERVRADLNYFKLGALLELGNMVVSIRAAERAAELAPDNDEYQKILNHLKEP